MSLFILLRKSSICSRPLRSMKCSTKLYREKIEIKQGTIKHYCTDLIGCVRSAVFKSLTAFKLPSKSACSIEALATIYEMERENS